MQLLLFGLLGLLAGVLSGLFGIGGGVVIVPGLILLGGLEIHTALGTSLGALLLPVGLLGALEYYRAGNVNVAAAGLVALGLFLGAYAGARIGLEIAPTALTRLFAVFLVVVAVRLWFAA